MYHIFTKTTLKDFHEKNPNLTQLINHNLLVIYLTFYTTFAKRALCAIRAQTAYQSLLNPYWYTSFQPLLFVK